MVQSTSSPIPQGYFAAKESYSVRDWKFGATSLGDLRAAQLNFWSNQIQYNQLDVHPMSCTIFASAGAVSDLTGYRFTKTQLTQMVEEARQFGFADDGWYINEAVDFVRSWYKRERSPNMATYRVDLASSDFSKVLQKGYSIVTGFRGNNQYNEDVEADGQLDNINIGDTTYGHAIRMAQDKNKPDYARVVIDNYVGYNKFNQYRIKLADMGKLVQNGVFFSDGYIFVNTMSNTFRDVPRNAQTEWFYSSVEWAAKEGLMSGFQDGSFRPNDTITRAQMAVLMKKLYDKLSQNK